MLFLAYQRLISSQFETLNSKWMNADGAPIGFGDDLLVGQHNVGGAMAPKNAAFHHDGVSPGISFATMRQWVTPTGGAYLFAPSVSLVQRLAA